MTTRMRPRHTRCWPRGGFVPAGNGTLISREGLRPPSFPPKAGGQQANLDCGGSKSGGTVWSGTGMKMRSFGVGRYAAAGAALGTALAICLHSWQVYATNQSMMSPEGVQFNAYLFAHLLGFHTNALLSMIVEPPG